LKNNNSYGKINKSLSPLLKDRLVYPAVVICVVPVKKVDRVFDGLVLNGYIRFDLLYNPGGLDQG